MDDVCEPVSLGQYVGQSRARVCVELLVLLLLLLPFP